MARPVTEQWYDQCGKKAKYSTEALVARIIERTVRERGVQLRAYKCEFCRSWHVTSKPERIQHVVESTVHSSIV